MDGVSSPPLMLLCHCLLLSLGRVNPLVFVDSPTCPQMLACSCPWNILGHIYLELQRPALIKTAFLNILWWNLTVFFDQFTVFMKVEVLKRSARVYTREIFLKDFQIWISLEIVVITVLFVVVMPIFNILVYYMLSSSKLAGFFFLTWLKCFYSLSFLIEKDGVNVNAKVALYPQYLLSLWSRLIHILSRLYSLGKKSH